MTEKAKENEETKEKPKSIYDLYSDFIDSQETNDLFSGSKGPVSNEDIAKSIGRIKDK